MSKNKGVSEGFKETELGVLPEEWGQQDEK